MRLPRASGRSTKLVDTKFVVPVMQLNAVTAAPFSKQKLSNYSEYRAFKIDRERGGGAGRWLPRRCPCAQAKPPA